MGPLTLATSGSAVTMLFQIDCGHMLPRRGSSPPPGRRARKRQARPTTSVDESAMSPTSPVLDRVRTRLNRLSMRADAVRLRLTPRVALTQRVEAESGDPGDWSFLRRPALLGLRRRALHLHRCIAAELALQARDGWDLVLRRGQLADHDDDAARGRGGLRGDDPLRARLVRPVPDAACPTRRADPAAGLHARPLAAAAPGGGAALQPRRVLLRGPGRDDEPRHQPLPLRSGHPRLGSVRVGSRSPVGEHRRLPTARSS